MRQKRLVLCDSEVDYAQQMAAFLEKDKDFPWGVTVYTKLKDAADFLEKEPESVLLLAESLAGEELPGHTAGQIVLLNESGEIRFPQIRHINKYQEAENVRKELLGLFARQDTAGYPSLQTGTTAKVTGLYSPVRRCLQTGFAITYSQLLAEDSRVLYLHLGYYAGRLELEAEEREGDLGALMYYLQGKNDKFPIYMRSVIRSLGNWDYIPAVRNSVNLPEIAGEDWVELIRRCRNMGMYDHIVLDLSEGIRGLADILCQCDQIFTIGKTDVVSRRKLENYEYMLERTGCQDVEGKTIQLTLPMFDRLPVALEEYTRGELAEYVKKFIDDGIK